MLFENPESLLKPIVSGASKKSAISPDCHLCFRTASTSDNFRRIFPNKWFWGTKFLLFLELSIDIHFMLSKRGYHELITQMYFKGHPLNPTDRILRGVPAHMRDDVLVDFQANPHRS